MIRPHGHSGQARPRLTAALVALATCLGIVSIDGDAHAGQAADAQSVPAVRAHGPAGEAIDVMTAARASALARAGDSASDESAAASVGEPVGERPGQSERGRLRVTDLWPRPPAWDLSAFVAWRGVRYRPYGYTRFSSRSHGGAAVGYYWTPHVKMEVEAGTSGKDEIDVGRPVDFDVPGLSYRPTIWSAHSVRDTAVVSLIGLYQFGDDASFHPNLGFGVELTRTRDVATTRAQTLSTGPGRPVVVLVPETVTTVDTEVTARPLITTGFKAYATPRFFVRSDVRVALGRSPTNISARIGAGFDF